MFEDNRSQSIILLFTKKEFTLFFNMAFTLFVCLFEALEFMRCEKILMKLKIFLLYVVGFNKVQQQQKTLRLQMILQFHFDPIYEK